MSKLKCSYLARLISDFSVPIMRIAANNTSYDMELKKQDFETQVERHEEISKLEEGVEKSA